MTETASETILIVYTHPECEYSSLLKEDLEKDQIEFKEIDVTLIDGAMDELMRITGGDRITPVTVEGEFVTIGYGGLG
mgnify:CR=1 FL=1